VLLVHGPVGSGKSALLGLAAARAAELGLTVLDASGIPSESNVAWSGLASLLRPVEHQLAKLPVALAAPLAAVMSLGPPAEGDRFTIGAATLAVLAGAAASAPVLVVVDDVQWLDAASAQAVLFAGRRLRAEGIVVLLARRDGDAPDQGPLDLDWADSIELKPLSTAAAAALLAKESPGPLSPSVREEVLGTASGNPQALVSIARLLTDDQRRGRAPLPDPLPAPSALERALTHRLCRLPASTRRALTVVAAHGRGDIGPIAAALRHLELEPTDLAPAETMGVVTITPGHVAFEHPLARSAAYHAAAPPERRAAHAALAVALRDEQTLEGRARHLAAAATAPDEDVAASLAAAADQASRCGAHVVASDLAERAASLSPEATDRDRRRILAADLALVGGATTRAAALLEAVGEPGDLSLRVRAAHVRGRLAAVAGGTRPAVDALVAAASEAAPTDPAGASTLLVQAAAAALSTGRHRQAAEHSRRAVQLAAGQEPLASLATLTSHAAQVVAGTSEDGAQVIELHRRLEADGVPLSVAYPALLAAASALVWLEDFGRADELTDAVVTAARRRADLEVLPLALVHRAWVQLRRPQVTAAVASATEALELAEAAGQRPVAITARQQLAHLAAFAGRYDEARARAGEVLAATDPRRLTPLRYNTTLTLAGVEMATGRYELAIELLEGIVDPESPTPFFRNPAAYGGAFQLVECYLKTGRRPEGEHLLELTEAVVGQLGQPWPKGQVARLHGLMRDDYDPCFTEAVRLLGHVAASEVSARIDWAGRLRSDGRRDEARQQLHEAFALARRTGYHALTPAIVAGLGALGDDVVASPDDLGRLSGQELAVAFSIAAGATVPEAAVELFLSPQTVEHELTEACRKLGLVDPGDLAARLRPTAPTPHRRCSISVLGAWRAHREGVEVPVPAGLAGTLVQLLAARGGHIPVDEAIEVLWPETDPELGRVRLRNVLARVRQVLGGCVERQGDLLAFAEGVDVDAITFRDEADTALAEATRDRAAAASRAATAVRSYRGPLLPDAIYEGWAEAPREQLRRRYLDLLDLLAQHAGDEQRWEDAARFRELAIEADPHDHERYVAAARARLRQGRRSSALHLCRKARLGAEELGVPPPAGLSEIEAEAGAASADS